MSLQKLLVVLFISTIPATVAAQHCTLQEKELEANTNGTAIDNTVVALFLHEMSVDGCFQSNCTEDICTELSSFETLTDQADKLEKGAVLTRKLRAMVDAIDATGIPWLRSYKASFRAATDDFLAGGFPQIKASEMQPNGITLYPNHFSGPLEKIELSDPISNSCVDAEPLNNNDCVATFQAAREALLLQMQQYRIYNELIEKNRTLTNEYLTALDGKWDTYNEHAATLYPWERYLNAKRLEKNIRGQRGFIEPPRTQLLAFHPTVTLEFNSDSDMNFDEALTIELLGFHRWSYKSKYRQIGASVIASYNQTDDDIGYGILLRLPQNWAVGVVKRDGDTSTVVSIDLAKFFTNNKTTRAVFNKYLN